MSELVTLRVYDLSRGMARQLSPSLLGKQVDGIWHTGVLVFGKEYFFGGGIQAMTPDLVVARYGSAQEIPLGTTSVSRAQFEAFLHEIHPRFTEATYDLLTHNCNNFSNELAIFLVGRSIPQHILDLPHEVMSTPMGAMFRPMIENMQNQLNASNPQPFSLPFNGSELPPTATATATARTSTLSRKLTVSTQPKLYLTPMIKRIKTLNLNYKVLTEEDVALFEDLVNVVEKQQKASDSQLLQWWQSLNKLLSSQETCIVFPALGIFRVLLLLPQTQSQSTEAILQVKKQSITHLLYLCEGKDMTLPSTHIVLILSVLVNVIADPIASDLVLSHIAQFLPFVFQSITESTNVDVRVVAAKVLGNCCLALQTEEEMIITMIIGGCIEVLERLSSAPLHQQDHSLTLEGVVVGIGRLLQTFQAARSLSMELGLFEVLHRLGELPSMRQSHLKPLLSEVAMLI